MFVAKSCQKTMFDLEFGLPETMRKRIKDTWAEVFLQVIMPLQLKAEKDFADLYCQNNGAPNTPVALLLGVLVLKEIFDLTDEETLEHLEYNLLWQYALAVRFEDAHVCRKTLHNFRVKLLESGRHRHLFTKLTKKIIELFGLKIGRQRLDSTHVVGNMKIVGRLGLFVQTIEQFLFKLNRMGQKDAIIAKLVKELPEQFHQRYLAREGYFSDARSSQAPRRLQTCAQDIWLLLQLFANDQKISALKQFKTLQRLFKEQCEVVDGADEQNKVQAKLPAADKDETAEPTPSDRHATVSQQSIETAADSTSAHDAVRAKQPSENPPPSKTQNTDVTVEVKPPQEIGSASLQSPSDPDATYGHKGKGYEYQIAETCAKENPFQVITQTYLNGANESDQTQTIPMIKKLAQAELKPEECRVDAGYVSGKNIVEAEDLGTRLIGPLPGKPPNPESMALSDFQFAESGTLLIACPNHKCPVQQGSADNSDTLYPDTLCPDKRDTSTSTRDASTREHWAVFAKEDCAACPLFANCPVQGKRERRITWSRETLATSKRQKETKTKEFKEEHKIRSGIEATNSELKHKHGAARLTVRGYARIELAMTFKSLALNIKRMFLYVLAQLQQPNSDGTCKTVAAVVGVFASVLLVFIGFARLNRRQAYFALKSIDFCIHPFPAAKAAGFITEPLRG